MESVVPGKGSALWIREAAVFGICFMSSET